MCSAHEQHATKKRPTAASLLGIVQADAAAVRGRAWHELIPERTDHDVERGGTWRKLLPWMQH